MPLGTEPTLNIQDKQRTKDTKISHHRQPHSHSQQYQFINSVSAPALTLCQCWTRYCSSVGLVGDNGAKQSKTFLHPTSNLDILAFVPWVSLGCCCCCHRSSWLLKKIGLVVNASDIFIPHLSFFRSTWYLLHFPVVFLFRLGLFSVLLWLKLTPVSFLPLQLSVSLRPPELEVP